MKKYLAILCCLLISLSTAAFADTVDSALSNETPERIRANVRAMVRSGASEDDAVAMVRTMQQARYTERQMEQLQNAVMEGLDQGLPPEPFFGKVNEGAAKQVDPEAVIGAMEKVQARYSFAYKQAGNLEMEKLRVRIMARNIAECMAAGVESGDIERLTLQLKTRTRTMTRTQASDLCQETFATVRIMARYGVNSRTSTETVEEALAQGLGTQEMKTLRSRFQEQAAAGSAEKLAQAYKESLKNGRNPEAPGASPSKGTNRNNAAGEGKSQGNQGGSGNNSGGNSAGGNSSGGGNGGGGNGGGKN